MARNAVFAGGLLQEAGALWSWWTGELAALFPRAHAWMSDEGGELILQVGRASTLALQAGQPGGPPGELAVWAGPLWDLNSADATDLALMCGQRKVRVALDQTLVHRLRTRVPMAGGATHEAVGYALLTDSPLAPEHMAFDWRRATLVPTQTDPGWIAIEVAICETETLTRVQDALAQIGVSAKAVVALELGGPTHHAFTLRRGTGPAFGWPGTHVRVLLLTSALVCLLLGPLGLGAYATWQERVVRKQLEKVLTQQALTEPNIRRAASAQVLAAAMAPKLGAIPLTGVLNDLAQLMGDHSWVEDLRVEDRQIRLTGRGAQPERAAKEISSSTLVRDVRLEAVNAAGGPDGVTVFQVIATIRTAP